MSQLKLPMHLSPFLIAHLIFISGVLSRKITISNMCDYTIWPGLITTNAAELMSSTGFSLRKHESKTITTPDDWNGRVWGRTHCSEDAKGRFSCVTGDCGSGKIACGYKSVSSPVTMAVINLQYSDILDFFYVSVLNGYNLPLLVVPSDSDCEGTGCVADLNTVCASELVVNSSDGKIAGCRSPCAAYGSPQYCCNNTRTCKPSSYSQIFKKSCPKALSNPLDEQNSTYICTSSDYRIIFCAGNTTYSSETTKSPPSSPRDITPSGSPQEITPSPSPQERTPTQSLSPQERTPSPSPQEITPAGPPLQEIRHNTTPRHLAPIITGSIGIGLLIISFVAILVLRPKWCGMSEKVKQDEVDDHIKLVPGMPMKFTYEELCVATDDFKERLGRGGFGSVFKGKLVDGTEIAVKRLEKLGQGMSEFLAEAEAIGSLHHFNLVRLIGFCAEKSFRLLVFEYLSNGSLDNWIFMNVQRSFLDWQTRMKIVLDIAKGLAYLHEDCRHTIIHLDVKPHNILLDSNFHAKIADFGLSKLIDRDMSQVQISMRGTPGYLAPEWYKPSGHITVKVDIYGFGIILLEIVCGQRNVDESQPESAFHLLKMLQKKAEQDRVIDIVENLDDECKQSDREEIIRMIKVAAWCLQDDPERRPLMSTVLKVLEGVMEVESNLNYHFSHAMTSSTFGNNNHISSAPPPSSVLSNPR